MNPTARDKKKQETRTRILEASTQLFLARGFTDVSTDEIAQLANVSKGSIFHHFSTKEELGISTLEHFMVRYEEIMSEVDNISPEDVFRIFTEESIKLGGQNPGFIKMILYYLLNLETFSKEIIARLSTALKDTLVPYFQFVSQLFTELGHKNPELRAILFLALIDGLSAYFSYFSKMDQVALPNISIAENSHAIVQEIINLFVKCKE